MRYEYKILPAPTKGQKAKGLKAPEARFANTLEECLNEQAAEGWPPRLKATTRRFRPMHPPPSRLRMTRP